MAADAGLEGQALPLWVLRHGKGQGVPVSGARVRAAAIYQLVTGHFHTHCNHRTGSAAHVALKVLTAYGRDIHSCIHSFHRPLQSISSGPDWGVDALGVRET